MSKWNEDRPSGVQFPPRAAHRIPVPPYLRRHIMVLADELGLDDQERRDLIEHLLKVEGGSVTNLTASEGRRVRDALQGAALVQAIYIMRGNLK